MIDKTDKALQICIAQWIELEATRLLYETQVAKLEKRLFAMECAVLGALQGAPVDRETAEAALIIIEQMLADEDRRPRDKHILADLSGLIQRRSGLYDPDFDTEGGE